MTRTLVAAALALSAAGCLHEPYAPHPCVRPDLTGCVVEAVGVAGNHAVPNSAIKEKIATAETSHTLGGILEDVPILSLWDRITVDYEKLDPFVLERDLARVERLYHARGYYDAHARAARVEKHKGKVRVEIVVDEGQPVHVSEVRFQWKDERLGAVVAASTSAAVAGAAAMLTAVPAGSAAGIATAEIAPAISAPPKDILKHLNRIARALPKGAVLDEDTFEDTKKKLRGSLTDSGYAYARVRARAEVDPGEHTAKLTYTIDTGPMSTFGNITLEGQGDLPEDRLRQAIDIRPNQPYSTEKIDSAQVALSDLRVLGSVDATPQLSANEPGSTTIPVAFHFTPTPLRTLKAGGGAELGSRVEVHGVVSWDHRNFLGGLRHFSVEAKPAVVFFPLSFATLTKPANTINPLLELRLHSELVQPGFLEARTRGLVSAAANLYQLQPTETLGYFELAGKTGLEREFWLSRVHLGLSFNMAFDQPVALDWPIRAEDTDCGYNALVLPYVQSVAVLDLRKGQDGKPDPLNPHTGVYIANDVQVAWYGSQDIRVRPELRGYLPISKRVTFAVRVSGGLLYPFGGDLKKQPLPKDDQTVFDTVAKAVTCPTPKAGILGPNEVRRGRYIQLLQLRGFTSGGPTSNRGYSYTGVGPQEVVRGISPFVRLDSQDNGRAALLPVATGGQVLWEGSLELRFPVYDKLGATVFVDGSDVRGTIADFGAPFAPHLSTGLGIRYLTPVGPLRADFGVRIPGAQVFGRNCPIYDANAAVSGVGPCPDMKDTSGYLDPKYGQAGTVFGLPLAISLAIGEAY